MKPQQRTAHEKPCFLPEETLDPRFNTHYGDVFVKLTANIGEE